jgi:excisionase family DNA binding protein
MAHQVWFAVGLLLRLDGLRRVGRGRFSNRIWQGIALLRNVNKMSEERLLTIEELAQRLQYSAKWIRAQVRAGRLPAIRFNQRAWRFHWPTVLAALSRLQ